ncbi:MAG: hypothetical protein IKX36_10745 [Prevotella sp.]|nr:hypothetical protein [Prevotella sp.]
MSKLKLLIALMMFVLGWTQSKAETLTENFDNVTILKDGAPVSGWSTGNSLSNGWFIVGNGGIYTDADYYTGYYGLISDGNEGKCIAYSYGKTNTAYLAVPEKLTGEVTFKAKATRTSSSYLSSVEVSLYEVNEDGGSYTIGNKIGTVKPTTSSWSSFSIDLGSEGKMVAFFMICAAIDDFSATIYEEGSEVKAVAVNAFEADETTVITDAAGNYTATFTATVENKGNVDITAADNVTVSLLDASKNVIAISEPVAIAQGATQDVSLTYNGTATKDGEVAFYVKEDLTDKVFATPAVITVRLAGARFAIDTDGTLQDLGFVATGETAEKTFTVTNDGTADMNITFSVPKSLNVPATLTVAAGASADFAVGLFTGAHGIKSGTVVLTTDAVDVKSFEIPVSGYVYPADAEHLDFTSLPPAWTAMGFTITDGTATAEYGTNTLTSPAILIKEGYALAIRGKLLSSMGELTVKGSSDAGDTWTAYTKTFNADGGEFGADTYTTVELTDIPASVNALLFEGMRFAIDDIAGFNYNDNAPKMEVTYDGNTVTEDDFGLLTADATHTYTVANVGTGTLSVNIASDGTDFTVSPETLEVAGGESATFDVTFHFPEETFGEKTGVITVTPANTGLSAVSINVKAMTKDPNLWDEDFEGGVMPQYWISEGNWEVTTPTYEGSNGTYMASIRSLNAPKALTTPRLQAKAGDELQFYIGMQYNDEPLVIEYSNDERETWTKIDANVESYTESGTVTFTAPADGYYYLRFTATFAMLDNFLGLKLAVKEHDMAIIASDIPAEGKAYVEYTATVTLQELTGKDEAISAVLYVNGEPVAVIDDASVTANSTKTFTFTYLPEVPGEDLPVYIEVTYEGGTLKTDVASLTIAPAYTLSENGGNTIEEGNQPVVNLIYTVTSEWNTICLPFAVDDFSVFGEGTTAYELKGFSAGVLQFSPVERMEAGYPYLLKIPAVAETITFRNVVIFSFTTTPQSETKDGVTFHGSYEPMEAPAMEGMYGVTDEGSIRRGGSGAHLLGLRGYFEMSADATSNEYGIMIEGAEVTGIRNVENNPFGSDVYDLGGRKVSDTKSLQPGVYVTNGKKVLVK